MISPAKALFWSQRLSAVALIPPLKLLGLWLVFNWGFEREAFMAMLASPTAQAMMTLFLFGMVVHASIGLWAIGGDYLTERMYPRSGKLLSTLWQFSCGALLLAYFVSGLLFVWQ